LIGNRVGGLPIEHGLVHPSTGEIGAE
jgi:hypothetical protein